MRTCVCILAGTKDCEKCQNGNNTGKVSTWTGSGEWNIMWKPNKNPKTRVTTNSEKEDYEYLCLFIDFLKEKGIVSLAMFDDDAYLKLKRDIEDFVNEDYNLNPYMYRRIKSAWKNKYGERWE